MNTLRLALCLLLLAAPAAIAPQLQAQDLPGPTPSAYEVVGISYIVPGGGPTITAYAATEMGSQVALYYDAEVDSYLNAGTQTVADGSAGPSGPTAEGVMYASSAPVMFQVQSYHYLVAYDYDAEDGEYSDPFGFAEGGGAYGENSIVVDAPLETIDPYGETGDQYIYVGGSWCQEYGAAPQINGISAVINGVSSGGLTLGSSGTLKIVGLSLTAGGTDPYPTPNVVSWPGSNGSGLSLGGVTVVGDGEIDVGFSVASGPSYAGTYGITVTTLAGTSNTGTIAVGDPTPVITGISPATWMAGTTYPCTIQIQGSGFGTNAVLNIVSADGGTEIASYSICGTSSDGLITASVTTANSYTPGAVNVSVTSQGYTGYGNGFVAAQGNSSGSNSKYVVIGPVALPVPQIMFNGINLANNGQPSCPGNVACVVVGQQIALTAIVPNLAAGVTLQSQTWSQPQGTVVGGYVASTAKGCVVPFPNTTSGACQDPQPCQTLSGTACITFYWVDAASPRTVTFSYTLSNGQGNSAAATFNVAAPTGINIKPEIGTVQTVLISGTPFLRLVGVITSPGMASGLRYTASATFPSIGGAFSWVQLLKTGSKVLTATGATVSCPSLPSEPQLDFSYPYGTGVPGTVYTTTIPNDTAIDTPGVQLVEVERNWTYSATMFLMWTPGSANAVPVPLASVGSRSSGDAINTLTAQTNGTMWAQQPCSTQSQDACVLSIPASDANNSYPTWNSTYVPASCIM